MATCRVCTRAHNDSEHVCESCATGVHNDLDEIATRYAKLSARPGVGGDNAGRRAPGFASSPPANLSVISMRDLRDPNSVPSVLGRWVVKVAIERGVTQPLGITEAVSFLQRHFAWMADRDWVMVFVRDVRRLKGRLRPVTGEPSGSIVIGRCPNTLTYVVESELGRTEHTRECGARLTAPIYGDTVECPDDRCGRRWLRREWVNLGRLINDPREQVAS